MDLLDYVEILGNHTVPYTLSLSPSTACSHGFDLYHVHPPVSKSPHARPRLGLTPAAIAPYRTACMNLKLDQLISLRYSILLLLPIEQMVERPELAIIDS